MRAVYFEETNRGPESLKQGEVHEPIPEDDQVLIRVAAAGVNVCAFTRGGGAYAEVVAVPEIFVFVAPSGIPLMHAASLPQATCLTLWCFTVLRKITPCPKNTDTWRWRGVGSIAIQYAKYIGCDVYATEGNNEKIQLCEVLGAKLCINYKKEDFCKRVKLETKGKGVDIILDCVGKDSFEKNLDCLSIGGSLIVTGVITGGSVDIDLQIIDQKKISILGASLMCVPDEVIVHLLAKAVDFVWPLISRGDIKPVIGKVFNFSEATDAVKAIQNYNLPGKVLLAP